MRGTEGRTPAWGTAGGKALEMSQLRSPLLHLNETLKTERPRYFDKRLDRWVGNNTCHTRLLAPFDLCGARTAKRTRFAVRSCFVPRRSSRRHYSHAKYRAEEHLESWRPQHSLPRSRLAQGSVQLCRCRSLRFCPYG